MMTRKSLTTFLVLAALSTPALADAPASSTMTGMRLAQYHMGETGSSSPTGKGNMDKSRSKTQDQHTATTPNTPDWNNYYEGRSCFTVLDSDGEPSTPWPDRCY
ncbi:MAG: hypothetical protein GEU76_14615 [Alphaproteobacteria bacterium]|nr:hypothetical protein [Alphaproteobacteria bacterium]